MLRPLVSLLLLLSLTVSALPAQADPGDADATDRWESAADLQPGTYTGTLDVTDTSDWYRIPHGASAGVRATLTYTGDAHLHLVMLADNGGYINDLHADYGYQSNSSTAVIFGQGAGAVRVGVYDYDATWGYPPTSDMQYTLVIEILPLPDLAVTALQVDNLDLITDWGSVGSGFLRRVTVDLANLGGSSGSGYLEVTARTASDGRTTTVGWAYVSLDAGASRQYSFHWNGAGIVGDVKVHAVVSSWLDSNWWNNEASINHYVLVGNTGAGVTAAVPGGYACLPSPLNVCAAAEASLNGAYVVAGASTLAGYSWASVSTSPSQVSLVANHYAPLTYVSFAGAHNVGPGGYASACASSWLVWECHSRYLP